MSSKISLESGEELVENLHRAKHERVPDMLAGHLYKIDPNDNWRSKCVIDTQSGERRNKVHKGMCRYQSLFR